MGHEMDTLQNCVDKSSRIVFFRRGGGVHGERNSDFRSTDGPLPPAVRLPAGDHIEPYIYQARPEEFLPLLPQ